MKNAIEKNTEENVLKNFCFNNGIFGCLKSTPIAQYNFKVHACLECCNLVAERWGVAFEDLDYLITAAQVSKAGKMGKNGSRDEIMELFGKMGGKTRLSQPDYRRSHDFMADAAGDR